MAAPDWIELFVRRLEGLGRLDDLRRAASHARRGEAEFYHPPLEVVRLECARDVRAMLAADLALDRGFLDAELKRRGLEEVWRRVAEPPGSAAPGR